MIKKTKPFLLICSIAILCLFACSKMKPDYPADAYVAKIGTDFVALPEYLFYLFRTEELFVSTGGPDIWDTPFEEDMSAEDTAKERALSSISRIKITCAKAKELGVIFEETDKERVQTEADAFILAIYGRYGIKLDDLGITDEELTAIMEQSVLYSKVYNTITDDFVVSEEHFNEYMRQYQIENNWFIPPDDAQAVEVLRQNYVAEMKNDIFEAQYERWAPDYVIEKNLDVWEEITITGLVLE